MAKKAATPTTVTGGTSGTRPPKARPMGEQSGGFGLEAGAISFAGLQPNSRQR
jgi:hypothetical protein